MIYFSQDRKVFFASIPTKEIVPFFLGVNKESLRTGDEAGNVP